jgi:hypothetical protein
VIAGDSRWAGPMAVCSVTARIGAAAGGEVLSMLGDYAYQVAFAWLVL